MEAGGAERVILNLAREFSDRSFQVDLLVAEARGPFIAQIPQGVRLIDFAVGRVSKAIFPLVKYLRQERPNVLLAAMDHTNIVASVARWIARVDTKVVATVHVPPRHSLLDRSGGWRRHLVPHLAALTYGSCHAVVAVSHGVAKDLSIRFPQIRGKLTVIHNPVITLEFLISANKPVVHPWFELGKPPIILGVGGLRPEKSFDVLIRAFALLHQKRELRLVILGEGTERRRLESLAHQLQVAHSLWMPGFVNAPASYMKRSSVFVLSSSFEGFGNVLVESMALGTPVVSTDCPYGPGEILERGAYGTLVPVGDPAALAVAIRDTLDNPSCSEMIMNRAREFSSLRIAERYLELFGCEM